jgi:hypothetical protein
MSDDVQGVQSTYEELDFEKARQLDSDLEPEKAREIAFKKLINRIGTKEEETDVGPVEATYRTIGTIDDLAMRVARMEDELDRIDRVAETARQTADRNAKRGDSVSKKDIARLKSRNEVVRKLAIDRSNTRGASVTASDVQEMAKPNTKLNYQTVYDAWDDLAMKWDGCSRTTNEEGTKVLHLSKADLTSSLVKTVEADLDRDDLSKRLLSRAEREGV